ncbi:MAG: hypothetical protein LIP11_13705 [Clostridiales bacterium]|nr:hypothetical protein [Clostridiales bacterium]
MIKKGKRRGTFRRIAAAFLVAALLAQQCSMAGIAADTQTDVQEVETQAVESQAQATETQTVATEPQSATEAQTAATESQTQATETQTATTESQTQTAETQTQTTEAETYDTETVAQTEKATEATGTQTPTEAENAAETETEKSRTANEEKTTESATESESQTTEAETELETETETETERSARQNAGEKLKRKELVKKLEKALPWLFVAKDVTIPEKATEALVTLVWEDQAEAVSETGADDEAAEDSETDGELQTGDDSLDTLILKGEEGQALLSELAKVSTVLADAQTTSEVTVINLYADENGDLDETQLTALFADKVLDITNMVYVINVVAVSVDQELEFSGYSLKRFGKTVTYSDLSEAGSVIYNFVATEEDAYTDYEGKLKLSGSLQGTILAPAATVESEGNLSGAIYAQSVTVKNENAKLLPIVFLADELEEEVQTVSESETTGTLAEMPETKSTAESEAMTGEETVAAPENVAQTEAGRSREAGTEGVSEVGSEAETEPEIETESVSETETEVASEVVETETEAETEVASEAETETEAETEVASEAETETEGADEASVASADTISGRSITVSAQALYGDAALRAGTDLVGYVALFTKNGSSLTRVSSVKALTFVSGSSGSQSLVFDNLASGTYYVAATDAAGNPLAATDENGNLLIVTNTETEESSQTEESETETEEGLSQEDGSAESENGTESATEDSLAGGEEATGTVLTATDGLRSPLVSVVLGEAESAAESVVVQYCYSEAWPEELFYCVVKLSINLNVFDRDGSALSTSEKFYMNIYSDEEMTTAVNESPIPFSMGGEAAKTKTYKLKLTKPQQTFYLRETDSTGAAVTTGENGFAYLMSLDDENAVTVSCGETAAAVSVWNKLNDSTIKIRVEDSSDGSLLSGATLAIKDASGNIYEVETVGSKTFPSGTTEIIWTNALTDGETYYLTEITAPTGYTPVPDVAFTVVRGGTTEVVLKNEVTVATGYALTVTQEVYAGDYQVYAYDTTTGTYQANGAYTYYVALFSDSARKNKVSNVVSLDVSGFTGNVTFLNLTQNGVYYVAATDEYGVVLSSTDELTVRYTNSGMVQMSEAVRSMVVQNVYASLPDGYRYTGTLTLTMNVTDSSGAAEAVTKTFYAGIYRNADYSDTPTVVQMSLSNASTVSVRRRILLSGESDMTYYIAEVDASGNRITDSSDFSYVVTVDQPAVTISKGSNLTVTITNKVKATKATLYLTKRVYDGTTLTAVSETFYVGLFKDADMTELYADPIAMTLDNASELTLKLTLNLGTASGVTVYVAEVDEDGNVITNQREFGYQIKIVNATAAFTQDSLEIQTILLNSVYGSTSTDDWDSIYSSTSSAYLSSGSSYTVDDNGSTTGVATSVETGDTAPLAAYAVLMGAAALAFGWSARRRRKQSSIL